jgi:hypothetical protein
LLLLAQCSAGVPLAIYACLKFGGYWPVAAGYAIGAFLTGVPIDKMILDEKYRQLQKIEQTRPPDPLRSMRK